MSSDMQSFIRSLFGENDRSHHDPGHYSQFGSLNEYRVLSEKKKRFILNQLRRGEVDNLFEQNTLTFIDHEGPKVVETYTAHVAECGHIVGLTDDNTLSSVCAICSMALCTRCSYLQCHSCKSLVCKNCSSNIGGTTVCSKCKASYILKRCIGSGIMALHNLLSKKF